MLRRSWLHCSWLLGLALLASVATADTPNVGDIIKLVGQLSSNSFAERETAMKELDAIGAPALPALKKATQSLDAETRRRAEELMARIEKRQESSRLLSPTKVSLQLKDVSLAEAVAMLAKHSGQEIALGGDPSKLTGRKVTLDLQDVPFWQALEPVMHLRTPDGQASV